MSLEIVEPTPIDAPGVIVEAEVQLHHGYRFLSAVLGQGLVGLIGWIMILTVIIAAIVVVIRHAGIPGCHRRGTVFFQLAHVCLLVFLCNVGVGGFMVAYVGLGPMDEMIMLLVGENLISISVGIGTVLAAVATSITLISGSFLMIAT